MPIGTPFHPRTSALCESMQWRDWSGFFAVSSYEVHHEHEYNAIRNAAALIDVSPLFKYRVGGPDATRLVDRLVTRDVPRMKVGQVAYTHWCDGQGKVIDDGTVSRLEPDVYRWTAAEPNLRWIASNGPDLAVRIEDVSDRTAALALQGPTSRDILVSCAGSAVAALRYFRVMRARIAGVPVEISRTGYTGNLGYEIWMDAERALPVWDALVEGGPAVRHHADGDAGARRGAHRGGADPAGRRLRQRAQGADPVPEVLPVRDRPGAAGEPGEGPLHRPGGPPPRGPRRAGAPAGRTRGRLGRARAPVRGGRASPPSFPRRPRGRRCPCIARAPRWGRRPARPGPPPSRS